MYGTYLLDGSYPALPQTELQPHPSGGPLWASHTSCLHPDQASPMHTSPTVLLLTHFLRAYFLPCPMSPSLTIELQEAYHSCVSLTTRYSCPNLLVPEILLIINVPLPF